MRKICIFLLAALLMAVSCNNADKLKLEQLQQEMSQLEQQAGGIEVPPSVSPNGEIDGFTFSLDKELYSIDAASSVEINYTLPEDSEVEVLVNGAWSATVRANGASGTVTLTAPDPASPSEVVLTATSQSGHSTAIALPVMLRDPYSDATRPRLDALGYYCFKPWNATVENYRKLAEAGLTMVTMEYDEGDPMEIMNYAQEAGLKVLLIVGGITGRYYEGTYTRETAESMINRFKTHPAVCGWHICDEPSVRDASKVKFMKDFVESLDDRPVYVNLHPLASPEGMGAPTYYDYVNTLADYLDFDFISFDIYPVLPGRIMPAWHMCLRVVSEAAKRRGIPFWAFAASCWINLEALVRERPNQHNLKLQIYTNLAYGAQTVEYFTIQDYGGTDFAPITRDGEWTRAYDYLKEANLEMQKRAYVFKGSDIKKVRQIGPDTPHDTVLSQHELPAEIGEIVTGWSATVSFVENNGSEYIAVVNNYWNIEQQIYVKLNAPVFLIDSDAQFTLYEAGDWEFTIPRGGMLVFKYK